MAGRADVERGVERRQAILTFLRAYVSEHGYAPSIPEIGAAVGLASYSNVHKHLLRMQQEGLIRMTPRTARAISIVEQA